MLYRLSDSAKRRRKPKENIAFDVACQSFQERKTSPSWVMTYEKTFSSLELENNHISFKKPLVVFEKHYVA